MDADIIKLFEEREELGKKLSDAIDAFCTNMPQVQKKLMVVEARASKADNLDYTEAEIEKLVNRQLENHPFYNDLDRAYNDYLEETS